jgi:hypothetical protein
MPTTMMWILTIGGTFKPLESYDHKRDLKTAEPTTMMWILTIGGSFKPLESYNHDSGFETVADCLG